MFGIICINPRPSCASSGSRVIIEISQWQQIISLMCKRSCFPCSSISEFILLTNIRLADFYSRYEYHATRPKISLTISSEVNYCRVTVHWFKIFQFSESKSLNGVGKISRKQFKPNIQHETDYNNSRGSPIPQPFQR